jgi:hypothetical protein
MGEVAVVVYSISAKMRKAFIVLRFGIESTANGGV